MIVKMVDVRFVDAIIIVISVLPGVALFLILRHRMRGWCAAIEAKENKGEGCAQEHYCNLSETPAAWAEENSIHDAGTMTSTELSSPKILAPVGPAPATGPAGSDTFRPASSECLESNLRIPQLTRCKSQPGARKS